MNKQRLVVRSTLFVVTVSSFYVLLCPPVHGGCIKTDKGILDAFSDIGKTCSHKHITPPCPIVIFNFSRILKCLTVLFGGAYWISSINNGLLKRCMKRAGSFFARLKTNGSSRLTYVRLSSQICFKFVVLPTYLAPVIINTGNWLFACIINFSRVLSIYIKVPFFVYFAFGLQYRRKN